MALDITGDFLGYSQAWGETENICAQRSYSSRFCIRGSSLLTGTDFWGRQFDAIRNPMSIRIASSLGGRRRSSMLEPYTSIQVSRVCISVCA